MSAVRAPGPLAAGRRAAGALLALVLPLLALSGCSSSGGSKASASSSSSGGSSSLSAVHVTGASGASPVVKVDAPLTVASTTRKVLAKGSGAGAESGQAVVIRFIGIDGRSGKQLTDQWTGTPASFLLGDSVIPGFVKALTGVSPGSTLLTAIAAKDGNNTASGLASAGVQAQDTLVYLIKVLAVGDAQVHGTPTPAPAGLPTVALDASTGAPTITIPPKVAPPAALRSAVLVAGTGPVVAKGQYITVQYTGVIYGTGKVFDSSWTSGSPATFQIGAGQVIPGWDAVLVGQHVGSQVLMVVPPAQGYGPAGQTDAGIKGTDTLVFVVDILTATT